MLQKLIFIVGKLLQCGISLTRLHKIMTHVNLMSEIFLFTTNSAQYVIVSVWWHEAPPPLRSEPLSHAASSTDSSLARIPPILLKAGIWMPYFSSSIFMLLISSSARGRSRRKNINGLRWKRQRARARAARVRKARERGDKLFLAHVG